MTSRSPFVQSTMTDQPQHVMLSNTGGTSETDHPTGDCHHGSLAVGSCSCSSTFLCEPYRRSGDDVRCSGRVRHTCPVGEGRPGVPLLLEHAWRGNKMQVDEALALPSPWWPVCPVEHPEGAKNSSLIPHGQQLSGSPPVLKESPDFSKLVGLPPKD